MTKNEFIAALVAPRRRSRSATLWREWIGVMNCGSCFRTPHVGTGRALGRTKQTAQIPHLTRVDRQYQKSVAADGQFWPKAWVDRCSQYHSPVPVDCAFAQLKRLLFNGGAMRHSESTSYR